MQRIIELYLHISEDNYFILKGAGGVPWDQIMENEFEYLSDRRVMVVIKLTIF